MVYFIAQLHTILSKRPVAEGRISLGDRLSLHVVERCLLEAGVKADKHFGKFLLAVLAVGREQAEKETLFMIHKFF